MTEGVIVALITGGASVLAVILSNRKSAREIDHKLATHQAVTDTKLDELTREVREHNGFARRMPVVETEIKGLKTDVGELKKYHMEKN